MARIIAAESVRELAACVTEHASAMDERHVCAALAKLVKQREFCSAASGAVEASAAQLMQTLLRMLMEAPAVGRRPRVEVLDSRGLSNALWAVVRGQCEGHPAFRRLLARLCEDGHGALTTCVAQQLSNIAWAVAKVVERSPAVGLSVGVGSGTGVGVGAEQVSGLFSAIGKAWLGGAGNECIPQGVANLLWAFAKVGCLGPAVAQPLWAQVGRMDLNAFKPQDFSNLLWALATGGAWDPAVARPLCSHVARMSLAPFKPQELVNMLWALAAGGHVERTLMEAVCVEAVGRRLRGWCTQDKANMVWALATLADRAPAPSGWQVAVQGRLLDAVAEGVLRGGMATARPQEWGNLLWGYATLRHSAPALFSEAVGLMEPHVGRFPPQELGNVMWAYGVVAPQGSLSDLVNAWQGHLLLKLKACNEQELSNVGWALAVAGGVGGAAAGRGRLARVLLGEAGRRDVSTFPTACLSQLHQLCVEVGSGGADASTLMQKQSLWRAACAARAAHVLSSDASGVSRDIRGVLQDMGADARLEQTSPCGVFCVDIEVREPFSLRASPPDSGACSGRGVAVEVDGPSHFMTNDATLPDGATRLRNRQLCRSYGCPVVSINVMRDWAPRSPGAREVMLRQRLGLPLPERVLVKVAVMAAAAPTTAISAPVAAATTAAAVKTDRKASPRVGGAPFSSSGVSSGGKGQWHL